MNKDVIKVYFNKSIGGCLFEMFSTECERCPLKKNHATIKYFGWFWFCSWHEKPPQLFFYMFKFLH